VKADQTIVNHCECGVAPRPHPARDDLSVENGASNEPIFQRREAWINRNANRRASRAAEKEK